MGQLINANDSIVDEAVVTCQCHDAQHIVRLTRFADDDQELFIEFQHESKQSITMALLRASVMVFTQGWQPAKDHITRIRHARRFFGCHWQEMVIERQQAQQLRDYLDRFLDQSNHTES